jgi:hypothetical protein
MDIEDINAVQRAIEDSLPPSIPDRNVYCPTGHMLSISECFIKIGREKFKLSGITKISDKLEENTADSSQQAVDISAVTPSVVRQHVPEAVGPAMEP